MSLLFLSAFAHAAPSAETCQAWADQLASGAAEAMAGLDAIDDRRIGGLSGQIRPGVVIARVQGSECHIQSVGSLDLSATLTVRNPVGRRDLTCPVSVTRAVVPLQIVLTGTRAAPHVESSTLPVEALTPYMKVCMRGAWVPSAVVQVASGWVREQQTDWHRQLEQWLAQAG